MENNIESKTTLIKRTLVECEIPISGKSQKIILETFLQQDKESMLSKLRTKIDKLAEKYPYIPLSSMSDTKKKKQPGDKEKDTIHSCMELILEYK